METGWVESLVVGARPFQGSVLSSEHAHPTNAALSSTGMCLQAFVEAFFYLAQKKFKMLPLHEQVASLIDLEAVQITVVLEIRLTWFQILLRHPLAL